MASFFEQKDRNVLPNWRSFENTAKLGEVNGLHKLHENKLFVPDITNLIEDWEFEKNIGVAAELVSSGSAFKISSYAINEASKFILNNKDRSSKELTKVAKSLINERAPERASLEISSLEIFSDFSNLTLVFKQIQSLKHRLINNPRNSIAWVDLSRYYSILGQNIKARRAILNATYLASNNRFVLRSVARFLAHTGEIDLAHDIIRKQAVTKVDPWLIATEISLANLRGRNSTFVKGGIGIMGSKNISPFDLSEVASAIGTLEMQHGNHKQSKKMFQFSLQDPNDNALAQAQWALQKNSSMSLTTDAYSNSDSAFEATARNFYERKLWLPALEKATDWFLDLPFSKSPILFGSHIARTYLNDHNKAIELGRIGLISHPNDIILVNNLIYSLCIIGEIEEAEQLFGKNDPLPKTDNEEIYWIATKGLLFFRKGIPELGRFFYKEAIDLARSKKNKTVFNLAVVHYTREEVLINSEYATPLVEQLNEILAGEQSAAVLKTRQEIELLLKK